MKKLSDIAREVVPKFEPCANCRDNPGWEQRGFVMPYMARCPCWYAHQERIKSFVDSEIGRREK